ncbi:MAG: selenoneine biosynthesis selenosugar synthase SenB [Gemmataceae bacterium]
MVCPAPPRSRSGNRITSLRWSHILRGLGFRSVILERWQSESCDALIALHAVRSADSIHAFRQQHPARPLTIALTGTDLYGSPADYEQTLESVRLGDAVIALTAPMKQRLPREFHEKTHVILQSAVKPHGTFSHSKQWFDVVSAGHLRPVKDPLVLARAVRLLPPTSRIRATLYGGSMNDELAEDVKREAQANGRFRWLGERSHGETQRAIARAHLFVLTSRSEGGPAVISEALVSGTPILATKIDATIGLLGSDYPGLFPVGDDRKLAKLLERCENDADFYRELKQMCRRLKPLVSPAREVRAWRDWRKSLTIH